jgi:aminoglycoside 6'-N-acetyltransferase I
MDLVDLASQPAEVHEAAARMLVDAFGNPYGWPSLELAVEEVSNILDEGFAIAALDEAGLAGWIGGLPEYHGNVWELHPLVVRRDSRMRGVGRKLVEHFEAEAARRGALTITLGTDDDSFMTSLSQVDLYSDVPKHIAEIRDLGNRHPFGFYQKLGYVVTGVVPDANGRNKPDIFMSKRVGVNIS